MFHVKEIVSKFKRTKWIHDQRARNHKERRGADDCLLLVMFNHIDRLGITDFYACVTEYATGDRYRYASEGVNAGDVYEIRYTEFDRASEPVKLDKKGAAPVKIF